MDGPCLHAPTAVEAAARFQKGVALSVWQNSGDEHSQWTAFLRRRRFFGQNAQAFTTSNDFWNNYEADVRLLKSLGANALRFSFEWARIEPAPGVIDAAAIARYHAILDCLEAHAITPNVTLHHFTHPQWFEAAGGFARPSNIAAFVSYCRRVFAEFGRRITWWATFNEASCFALCGYIMGLWAPGQRFRFVKAGRVLGNMLRAHVAAYRALKAMPGGAAAQIGFVHQHIRFVPSCNWLAGLVVRPVCRWMTYWFAEAAVLRLFTTGTFTWRAPLLPWRTEHFHLPEAIGAADWWGINYYSRPAISSRFRLVGLDPLSEPLSGMGMPLVAGDLSRHIATAHAALRVPVIVSETGVSDKSSLLRARCISSYYAEVLRAIAAGADVRGVYYWTLMDNIEWHHGFRQYFGLFEWRPAAFGGPDRPEDGSALALRPGSEALVALHARWPDTLKELRAFARRQQEQEGAASKAAATQPRLVLPVHALAEGGAADEDEARAAAAAAAAAAQGPEQRLQRPQLAAATAESLAAAGAPQPERLAQQAAQADEAAAHSAEGVQEPLLRQGGRLSDVA